MQQEIEYYKKKIECQNQKGDTFLDSIMGGTGKENNSA